MNAIVLVDDDSSNKRIFLEALEIVINAGIHYACRHATLAREMAKTTNGKRKAELLKIADICDHVPAHPARTFHEALQTMWFCNLFIFFDCKYEGISPGRVDQYLYPYYKSDIEEGRLTRENAIELLELLRFVKRHDIHLEKMITHRFPLEKGPEVMKLFQTARTGKIMFIWL